MIGTIYALALLVNGHFDSLLFRSPQSSDLNTNTSIEASRQDISGLCFLSIDPGSLTPTSPMCPGASTGSIVFNINGINPGTPPYTYDWDNLGTGPNDSYPGDGQSTNTTLNSIPAGNYQMIVTDDAGCLASASVTVVSATPFNVNTVVDPIEGCESTGGINIVTYSGPAGIPIYDWDLQSTPYNDDFGVGQTNYGLPVGEDDAEDLLTNDLNGTYYLTIKVSDFPANPTYTCIYKDTFIVATENVAGICPSGTISYYAGTSNGALTYQWQVDSTGTFLNLNNGTYYSNVTTPTLTVMNALSSWYGHKYRAKMMQGTTTTYSQTFTLKFRVCWDAGASTTAWENAINWNCNILPNAYTDVYINSGFSLYPKLNDNRSCRSVIMQPGASVEVRSPFKLSVLGD